MLFWLLLALMTGAAVLAVLWPLSRSAAAGDWQDKRAADLAVYRDQLAEIERDRARGLIAAGEAEAARLEVSRRILATDAAGDRPVAGSPLARRVAASLALVGVPLVAFAFYGATGSPTLPGAPLASRLIESPELQQLDLLVRRVEAHLAENPGDGRGWEVLAPIYLRAGRFSDAVKARENARRLLGGTPARDTDLGEALVAEANGVITEAAHAAFVRAVDADPGSRKAKFFLGLAAEQDGRPVEAARIWKELAESGEADDPWRIAAARRLERLSAESSRR